MSEIKLKSPISIEMDVVETEDYLPSIKMCVKVQVNHPTGVFIYQADDIWFECLQWDTFVLNLKQIFVKNKATLIDMSEGFELDFYPKEKSNLILLHLKCKEHIASGNESISLDYKCTIGQDVFGEIIDKFNNFPKWW